MSGKPTLGSTAKNVGVGAAKKAIKAKLAVVALVVGAVAFLVGGLYVMTLSIGGAGSGSEAYVVNRAVDSDSPDTMVSLAMEVAGQYQVPWELVAATAKVMTNYGRTVPTDTVKRGVDPDTYIIPEIKPPINVSASDRTYEGAFLLDNSVAVGVSLQVVGQAAAWVAGHLHTYMTEVNPEWSGTTGETWPRDEESWKLAVDKLPLMPVASAAVATTYGPPTCASGTAVRLVSDEIAAAAVSFAGTPPGLKLASAGKLTVAAAVDQIIALSQAATAAAPLGKVYLTVGTYGMGLEADPTARTSDVLLDQLVSAVGAENLVLVRPRNPGDAFYAPAVSPVPEVWAAYDALVARSPGVTILDASNWPNLVGLAIDIDASATADPAAITAPTGFEADGIHPTLDASKLLGAWLNPQVCPPAPLPPTPATSVASARSAAIVALAKSWRTGEADPFAACSGGGLSAGLTSPATSAYLDSKTLANVLATIRHLESGDDYTNSVHAVAVTGTNGGGNPTGAYQYIYKTWGQYDGFNEAYLAPPAVQDKRATGDVDTVLKSFAGDIQWIPVVWYVGATGAKRVQSGEKTWDWIPNAGFNKYSVGQYQAIWMATYRLISAGSPVTGLGPAQLLALSNGQTVGTTNAGSVLNTSTSFCPISVISGNTLQGPDCDGLTGTGSTFMGVPNGSITLDMLTYSPNSGYLQPTASQAWDQLVAAADAAGFAGQLKGTGFSPRPGTYSNHTIGLAIDINALTWASMGEAVRVAGEPLPVYPTFNSPLYAFLRQSAWKYGFCNPKWARPLSLNGTATGGKDAAGNGNHLEAWHWEFIPGGTVLPGAKTGDLNGPAGIPD